MTGEPPSSPGADQATFTLVPDEVTDTASGAAGTVLRFVVSAVMARSRAAYRSPRARSVAESSASAVFAAVSAVVNARHEASVYRSSARADAVPTRFSSLRLGSGTSWFAARVRLRVRRSASSCVASPAPRRARAAASSRRNTAKSIVPYRSASSDSPSYRSTAFRSADRSVSAGGSTWSKVIRPRLATYGCEESAFVVSRRCTACVPVTGFGRVRLVVPPDDHELPVTGRGTVAYGVPGASASEESR